MGSSFSGCSVGGGRITSSEKEGKEKEGTERISTSVPKQEPDASSTSLAGGAATAAAAASRNLEEPCPPGAQQWPCSNCHATVAVSSVVDPHEEARCSNCGGIQVRVAEPTVQERRKGGENSLAAASSLLMPLPYIVRYLERVVSPNPSTSESAIGAEGRRALEGVDAASALMDRSSYYSEGEDEENYDEDDDGDDDGDEEETLEASPRPVDFAMMICEGDELRPVDPVAATLASAPSPIPARLKLDPSASTSSPTPVMLNRHSSSTSSRPRSPPGRMDGSLQPRAQNEDEEERGNEPFELISSSFPERLLPPNKKLRTA
jgi:hypothetical protein